jgi:tight adherence protein C
METPNEESRAKIVQSLTEAVDSLTDAVASGRLGFDYAVKEYVEQTDNELSHAFHEYVEALQLGDETSRISTKEESRRHEEIRRVVLRKIAQQFDVPEMTAFVDAVLESQDKRISIARTLERQAAQLHQSRFAG